MGIYKNSSNTENNCKIFPQVHFILKNLIFSILIIGILFSATALKPNNMSEDAFDIFLNCNETDGYICPYSEINCGPLLNHDVQHALDLTKQYNEIGIKLIRTHDFSGPTDITTIFPDWDADSNLESSYDFMSSDKYISSIINSNCQVFYRLGESASSNNKLRIPPSNVSKWANICKHIVMHYNDGWNNGFFYNIIYWEIWNEPDLLGFWNGSAQEYCTLFETTLKTLKSYNESLKIGGPCTSSLTNDEYTTNFLGYLMDNNIYLDFFSWHHYSDNPNELYESSKYIRNLLDSYGFTYTENINTEWNINILTPQREKDNAKNGAFTACSLIAFNNSELDHAFRYRGTQDPNWLMRILGLDLSLFTHDGIYKKPALSYLVMNYISNETPIRLKTPEINTSNGITYIAGISEDKTNISVLISNFNLKATLYNLEFINLPWNDTYIVAHYQIDSDYDFEILEKSTENSSI